MLEDGAFKHDALFETLRYEPGEVDCGVDADGSEARSGIDSWSELVGGERAELGHLVSAKSSMSCRESTYIRYNVLEPRTR